MKSYALMGENVNSMFLITDQPPAFYQMFTFTNVLHSFVRHYLPPDEAIAPMMVPRFLVPRPPSPRMASSTWAFTSGSVVPPLP